jgi:hypothetical protein
VGFNFPEVGRFAAWTIDATFPEIRVLLNQLQLPGGWQICCLDHSCDFRGNSCFVRSARKPPGSLDDLQIHRRCFIIVEMHRAYKENFPVGDSQNVPFFSFRISNLL